MRSHVTVLAWLHIVLDGAGLLLGLLAVFAFGGLGLFASSSAGTGAATNLGPYAFLAGLLLVAVAIVGLPGLIAGVGLLQYAPWARVLGILVSILYLLNFPFGTAVGVYGLWVLTNRETIELMEPRPVR
ncbi:MAG: hypothetical protein IT208_11300 [Chthonomonadales bacterium]|nr:hypothetical protein [Chthonomonadales bacterium]